MDLTYADIQKAINELGPPPVAQSPLYTSQSMIDRMKGEPNFPFGIKFIESPLFPFTKSNGEVIHGAFIPPMDIEMSMPELVFKSELDSNIVTVTANMYFKQKP